MLHELDTVALTHDIKKEGLKQGDIGAIVHVHGGGISYEVEFVTAQGETLALLMLSPKDIRSIEKKEILHVRPLDHAAA